MRQCKGVNSWYLGLKYWHFEIQHFWRRSDRYLCKFSFTFLWYLWIKESRFLLFDICDRPLFYSPSVRKISYFQNWHAKVLSNMFFAIPSFPGNWRFSLIFEEKGFCQTWIVHGLISWEFWEQKLIILLISLGETGENLTFAYLTSYRGRNNHFCDRHSAPIVYINPHRRVHLHHDYHHNCHHYLIIIMVIIIIIIMKSLLSLRGLLANVCKSSLSSSLLSLSLSLLS